MLPPSPEEGCSLEIESEAFLVIIRDYTAKLKVLLHLQLLICKQLGVNFYAANRSACNCGTRCDHPERPSSESLAVATLSLRFFFSF